MSDLTVADDIVDTALQYAGRGWAVLPTFNKAPPRGFARGVWGATTDPATIIRWFERVYPGAEIGIACGPPVVVDIDTPMPELLALQSTTLSATTPRGSVHLYFEGEGIRNQVFDWGEIRSRGYLVIAPPAHGRRWLNNLPLAPLPEWLAIAKTKTPCVSSGSIPHWSEVIADHRKTVARWSWEETYALYACDHARKRVEQALFGARQATLNRETFMLGQYAGAGAIERSRVAMMMELGMLANKSLDSEGRTFLQERGRLDIRKRILRALADGMANPWLPGFFIARGKADDHVGGSRTARLRDQSSRILQRGDVASRRTRCARHYKVHTPGRRSCDDRGLFQDLKRERERSSRLRICGRADAEP